MRDFVTKATLATFPLITDSHSELFIYSSPKSEIPMLLCTLAQTSYKTTIIILITDFIPHTIDSYQISYLFHPRRNSACSRLLFSTYLYSKSNLGLELNGYPR